MPSKAILTIIIPKPSMGGAQPSHFLEEFKIDDATDTHEVKHALDGSWTWTGSVNVEHFTPDFMKLLCNLDAECFSLFKSWKISLRFSAF
jgi:hypothetical protein